MGIQNQVIKPQGCKDCPFFEIRHSSLGISLFCRFYKKGAFDLKNEKFDFCKIYQIIVTESTNKEIKSYGGKL
jgi:hypothetical protein